MIHDLPGRSQFLQATSPIVAGRSGTVTLVAEPGHAGFVLVSLTPEKPFYPGDPGDPLVGSPIITAVR